VWLCPHFEN